MNELYVYDGIEVKLTGRTAVKQMKESTISGSGRKEQILVEITPTDPSMEWKKWVREIDLYLIKAAGN